MSIIEIFALLIIIYVAYRLYTDKSIIPTDIEIEEWKKLINEKLKPSVPEPSTIIPDDNSSKQPSGPYITYTGAIKLRNKCLNLNDNNTENGNKITIWDCNNSNAQKWNWNNQDMKLKLVSNPNKCAQINPYDPRLHLYDCKDNENGQKFLYVLENKHFQQNEKNLNLDNGNTTNGNPFSLINDFQPNNENQMFTWA